MTKTHVNTLDQAKVNNEPEKLALKQTLSHFQLILLEKNDG